MNSREQHVHIKPEFTQEGIIEIRNAEFKIHQFQGTGYSLKSIGSIVDLVKRKGTSRNTVLFYTGEAVQVILDDGIMDRPQDRAYYDFCISNEYSEWKKILNTPLSQKDFIKFLQRRPEGELPGIENLLVSIQYLKLATQMVGDYQYDDNNNLTFMFKVGDVEGSAKLPHVITVNIPLLNESDLITSLEIELELNKPKSENDKPTFVLTCPKLSRYLKEATDYEIEKMKEALPGYLILAGNMGR